MDSESGLGQAQFLEGDRIFPLGPKTTNMSPGCRLPREGSWSQPGASFYILPSDFTGLAMGSSWWLSLCSGAPCHPPWAGFPTLTLEEQQNPHLPSPGEYAFRKWAEWTVSSCEKMRLDLQGLLKGPWIQLLSLCSHGWKKGWQQGWIVSREERVLSLCPAVFSLAWKLNFLLCLWVFMLFLTFKSQRFGLLPCLSPGCFWPLEMLSVPIALGFGRSIQLAYQGIGGWL